MKISILLNYINATLERYGDVECFMDLDPDSDELFDIEGVFCDVDPSNEKLVSLVFATFAIRASLHAVK